MCLSHGFSQESLQLDIESAERLPGQGADGLKWQVPLSAVTNMTLWPRIGWFSHDLEGPFRRMSLLRIQLLFLGNSHKPGLGGSHWYQGTPQNLRVTWWEGWHAVASQEALLKQYTHFHDCWKECQACRVKQGSPDAPCKS